MNAKIVNSYYKTKKSANSLREFKNDIL